MAKQDEAPEPIPEVTEVVIEIGGHCITVKSPRPMEDVAAQAFGLYEQTREDAKRIPIGFDVGGGQFERAEERDFSTLDAGEEEDRARVGRLDQKGITAPRLD